MDKEYLVSLGLTEEQAKNVLTKHQDVVAGLPSTQDLEAEIANLKEQVVERDAQLEELSNFDGTEAGLKEKILELEAKNEKTVQEWQDRLNTQKFEHALEVYLSGVGAKSVDVLRKMVDLDELTLNEDGTIKGIEEQMKALKKSHPYLFNDETEEVKPRITTGTHERTDEDDPFIKGLLGN